MISEIPRDTTFPGGVESTPTDVAFGKGAEMIVWSRMLPAVARRIRRCSSVVSVVGERCGTVAS